MVLKRVRGWLPWLKAAVWLGGLAPLAWLGWRVADADLGPNPVQTLEYFTGRWALRLLLVTLAMTPLRLAVGRPQPIQLRRLLGLWAYAYMCVHFSIYLTFDLEFSPAKLADDLVKRAFITAGFTCWLLLLPLAITSTQGWQRRLKRRWRVLHRLIYFAAGAAVLHYGWGVKKDRSWPLLYATVLAALLLLRLPWKRWSRAILRAQTIT
ncbi:MAG: sulfoxide reductase heme-binding subunit YedZ [Gammaproteobacteria bacterium]|nr:sulfoxide reductase heme-binding subunit YedZ [Gammaproteobacteria bacterium]